MFKCVWPESFHREFCNKLGNLDYINGPNLKHHQLGSLPHIVLSLSTRKLYRIAKNRGKPKYMKLLALAAMDGNSSVPLDK